MKPQQSLDLQFSVEISTLISELSKSISAARKARLSVDVEYKNNERHSSVVVRVTKVD